MLKLLGNPPEDQAVHLLHMCRGPISISGMLFVWWFSLCESMDLGYLLCKSSCGVLDPQPWNRGGSWEAMGMIPVILLEAGNVEPELATSCSQKGLPVEGGGHQPAHKTSTPKLSRLHDVQR